MNLKILTYWPTDHGEIFYSVPNQSAIDNACEQVAHYCRNELAAKYGHWKLAEERLNIALNFLKNTNSGFEYLIFKRIAELCAEEKSMVVIESCSIIDYLMGLTAVNPLKPHYYCPKCHRVEERDDVKDGFDLPQKLCPDCGEAMNRDGHNCSEYLNWKESKRGNFQKRIVGIQFTKRILQKMCHNCLYPDFYKSDEFKYYSIPFHADYLYDMIYSLGDRTGILHSEIPLCDKKLWYNFWQSINEDMQAKNDVDQPRIDNLSENHTFYEITRALGYFHGTFTEQKNMEHLKQTSYYVLKDEVFEMFVDNGFTYEEAAHNTNLAIGSLRDDFSTLPDAIKENLNKAIHLWPKYFCIVQILNKYILDWYQKNYPKGI